MPFRPRQQHGSLRIFRRAFSATYTIIALVGLCALVSLAIDFGRVQVAKAELQTAADAAVLAAADGFSSGAAQAKADAVALAAQNSCEGTSVILDADADIDFGHWENSTKTFTPLDGAAQSAADAIRVTAQRIASRNTAIPLIFARVVGQNACDVRATAIATSLAPSPPHAIIGLDSLQIDGNVRTDSYNAALGRYSPSSASDSGSIASNGNINLKGNVSIRGNAHPGVGGLLTCTSNVSITGSRSPLDAPLYYPPVSPGSHATNNDNSAIPGQFLRDGNFSVSAKSTASLSAGTYHFSSFNLAGTATLNISGPVTIYVNGDLSALGSIHVAQDLPDNLRLRIVGAHDVTIGGNTSLAADIYAPQSRVRLIGNGDIFGAIVGQTATITGNASVHLDESLKRSDLPHKISLVH